MDHCTRLYAEVNFVPTWFTRNQKLRRSKKRQALLVLMMIGGMAALTIQTWRDRAELRGQLSAMKTSLVSTNQKITEVEKLRIERTQLSRLVEIHRELYQPISYSEVTGTLASLTPPSISLRGLGIQTQKTTTRRKLSESELAAAKAANPKGRVRDTVSETRAVVSIDVMGLAPSDVDVANFIGSLASSNVFQNVKMEFARQGTWDGSLTREFRIRMEIPLDRRYTPSQPQEVADAH